MPKASYSEKLLDPRWQEKRLRVFERYKFSCGSCGSKTNTLNAHHRYYKKGRFPWEYPDWAFVCLCSFCHEKIHKEHRLKDGAFSPSAWETIIEKMGIIDPPLLLEKLVNQTVSKNEVSPKDAFEMVASEIGEFVRKKVVESLDANQENVK